MADPKDKSFVVYEDWDRRESQQAYLARRVGRGDPDKLMPLLCEPPAFVEMEHVAFG